MAKDRYYKHPKKSQFDDPKIMDEFRSHIISGMTIQTACELVGMSTSAWNNYRLKHPEYKAKFKRWKHTLEAKSKMIIAGKILNESDPGTAIYLLDRQTRLETAKVKAELTRAQTKKVKAETELIERQNQQTHQIADSITESMSKLSIDELRRLASLRETVGGEDDNEV